MSRDRNASRTRCRCTVRTVVDTDIGSRTAKVTDSTPTELLGAQCTASDAVRKVVTWRGRGSVGVESLASASNEPTFTSKAVTPDHRSRPRDLFRSRGKCLHRSPQPAADHENAELN